MRTARGEKRLNETQQEVSKDRSGAEAIRQALPSQIAVLAGFALWLALAGARLAASLSAAA